jgi:hypothetical protein
MAANPLLTSIKQAEKDNRFLLRQFRREIGRGDAPRGKVLASYRQARRDMRRVLRDDTERFTAARVGEVTQRLRDELDDIARRVATGAVERGQESAAAQLEAYTAVAFAPVRDAPDVTQLQAAAMEPPIAQLRQIERAAALGQYDLILGDDDTNLGLLTPTPTQGSFERWMTTALALGLFAWLFGRDGRRVKDSPFKKQAIAAIDERTTDTCIRVHGQIQSFDKPFVLRGQPRYADKMQQPPFHDHCRTTSALYQDEYDLGLTDRMRDAARGEAGRRREINEQIADVKKRLVKAGAQPDARMRQDDGKRVIELRRELKRLRREMQTEIHPSSGVTGT